VIRYGSVCSGVEAATVAWHPLGWQAQWFSEIEAFPSAVLAHHYPNVPNHGDMTNFKEWNDDSIDLLVGGTPCQSFSVAGLRKGLDDPRGNLMLTYLAIAARYKPRWVAWENVPGVLSSNEGRDFGTFLGALGQLGYGFAYRVLDAQYFGVAQRRRRVFVVGYLGDWRRAAAVLFERESLSGHSAPSRETGQGTTKYAQASVGSQKQTIGTLMANAGTKLWLGNQEALSGDYHIICPPVSPCLETQVGGLRHPDTQAYALVPALTASMSKPLGYGGKDEFIAFGAQNSATQGDSVSEHVTPTLDKSKTPGVTNGMAVRRLTPRECERLQGFPDDYTLIPYRNKLAADGPRYKSMGNSMAVPVMRWIGERIQMVEQYA
jgi:DNA (cytosine-5)-methyltransferase 1